MTSKSFLTLQALWWHIPNPDIPIVIRLNLDPLRRESQHSRLDEDQLTLSPGWQVTHDHLLDDTLPFLRFLDGLRLQRLRLIL